MDPPHYVSPSLVDSTLVGTSLQLKQQAIIYEEDAKSMKLDCTDYVINDLKVFSKKNGVIAIITKSRLDFIKHAHFWGCYIEEQSNLLVNKLFTKRL
jgi:hypothetical protein